MLIRRSNIITAGVLGVFAAGMLAACGDDGTSAADGAGDSEEVRDAALEYAECMREHGVDMPDPEVSENGEMQIQMTPGEAGMVPEEMDAAQEECQPIMDEVRSENEREISPEELAERQDQVVELAECMRERGHDFPDPQVSEDGGVMINGGSGVAPGEPGAEELEADLEECHEEADMPLPGAGGSLSSSDEDDA